MELCGIFIEGEVMGFFEQWAFLVIGAVFGSWMQERVPIYGSQRWLLVGFAFAIMVVGALLGEQ